MNLACVKSHSRTGSENFFIQKVSSKKPKPKVDPYPFLSGTEQRDLSAPATDKMPLQGTDFTKNKTKSYNTENLEEQFPDVYEALQEVKKDPANPEKHFRLAQLYHRCRVYDMALEEYQWASELDPDKPAYFEKLGRLWRDSGAFQSGIDSVQKALQLDKDSVDGWNTLGTIYDCLGDHGQAQKAYSRALSISPDLDYVHNNLCSSFLEVGDYTRALPHCEQAVQLNPGFTVAQNNLGIAYGMLGDVSKAYAAFLKASDEASAHNNLGWVLLQKSELEGASEQFKLAAKLRPYYRLANKNYYLTKDLKFKRDGRTAGKSDADTQIRTLDGSEFSGQPQIDRMNLDLKALPTALDHESVISSLCGSQDVLKTTEISSDMDIRIVLGDDILKRQAILKRN